jgi:NAD(P)-dependent dehydrogenase (short-subunit alcohol dehydrogenase family)
MTATPSVVLITGSGEGIGAGLAEHLGRAGFRLACHYFTGEEQARAIAQRFEGIAISGDFSQPGEARRAVEEAAVHFGRLDAIINNAGVDFGPVDFLEMPMDRYELMVRVNLDAVFEACQAAARQFFAQGSGGRIINISSVHAQATLARRAAYALTKGGLEALTRALALELGPRGVTVNAIAPGFIEIERSRTSFAEYDRQKVAAVIPANRVGFPEDIAHAAAYLLSPEAAYVNGMVLTVDGGSRAQLSFPI